MKYTPLIILCCFSSLVLSCHIKYHALEITNDKHVERAIELLDNDPSHQSDGIQTLQDLLLDQRYHKKIIEYQDRLIGIIIFKKCHKKSYLYRLAFEEDIIKQESLHLLTKILLQTRCYNSRDFTVEGNLESVQYWRKKFRHGKKKSNNH